MWFKDVPGPFGGPTPVKGSEGNLGHTQCTHMAGGLDVPGPFGEGKITEARKCCKTI